MIVIMPRTIYRVILCFIDITVPTIDKIKPMVIRKTIKANSMTCPSRGVTGIRRRKIINVMNGTRTNTFAAVRILRSLV